MSDQDMLREWSRLVQREDESIDVAEAALAIARTEYPQLDASEQLSRLDRMAAGVHLPDEASALANIGALNHHLFEQEGFKGNDQDYDDPRNSFLNDVLDRRTGIPITLSLVYTEIARRLGLPIVGVGFPGHFLVKYLSQPSIRSVSGPAEAEPSEPEPGDDAGESAIIIDPFNRGAILNRESCARLLKTHFGEDAELKPEYFAASTPKSILARMLNNLKGCYFRRHNFPRVLLLIEMALAIDPASAGDVRDRGMVYFALKRYREAMADFNLYLSLAPREDPQVKEVLTAIQRIRAMMN